MLSVPVNAGEVIGVLPSEGPSAPEIHFEIFSDTLPPIEALETSMFDSMDADAKPILVGLLDNDGDGATNAEEMKLGTNPGDPASKPDAAALAKLRGK